MPECPSVKEQIIPCDPAVSVRTIRLIRIQNEVTGS
jgi:hypothetical protein